MDGEPPKDLVQAYYDDRVHGKLQDFTEFNPRIEAAVALVAEWAPPSPQRVLEIGCGIGATSWRMARAWPDAHVVGVDISERSIEVAKTCFSRENLEYRAMIVGEDALQGTFDLVLLMDVYEHIGPSDRPVLHRAIRDLLSDESRLVLTVPTPEILDYARGNDPSGIQPIDENIRISDIARLAEETYTDVLLHKKIGIWNYGDYLHLVFGRFRSLAPVGLRIPKPHLGYRHLVKSRFVGDERDTDGLKDYLGDDQLRPSERRSERQFAVSSMERTALAAKWRGTW